MHNLAPLLGIDLRDLPIDHPRRIHCDIGTMMTTTELLVIGAGPYGLSTAAAAKAAGIEVMVVGEPMAFWKQNMPRGMLLRSGLDWHLDAAGVHTLEAFLEEEGIPRSAVHPIPVETFHDYAEWFRRCKKIDVHRAHVERVHRVEDGLEAWVRGGEVIRAERVVAAPGLAPFVHVPNEISAHVASERLAHTATRVSFGDLVGKRCLIVGGRQSAFEWAALMVESGVESVDLVFRHDAPSFAPSDWSFTDAMIDNTLRVRGWFRRLARSEREAIHRRFWSVGRLQLEPWLSPRIANKRIRVWPGTTVAQWSTTVGGEIEARLNGGDVLRADEVICATGYRVDVARVSYLAPAIASGALEVNDGIPVLDEDFQTTVPGLYVVGQASMPHFGPFFGFLRGCIASARIVVASMHEVNKSWKSAA
jgi:cation diffusion facilitator CzcD-associated flavoprotein CzcO